MSADHRRDAYASAGARASQRKPARRTTGELGTGPVTRGARRGGHRRRRSNAPTALLAIGLIAGFAVICWLLISHNQGTFDPFVEIDAQLRTEAPGMFEADELDGDGRRLITAELEQGHARWFAAARAEAGADQRGVMGTYWNLAAADLAALEAVQAAYRRAGMSFTFRRQWFGVETESVTAPAMADPVTGAPPPTAEPTPERATKPAQEPAPAPAKTPTPTPAPAPPPEPDGVHRTL